MTEASLKVVKAERQAEIQPKRIAEEVTRMRMTLRTKLDMAEHELALAQAIRESKQDSLMD
ncbi:MAG: hypothetical protein GWQ05_04150 [Verrucomicrobiaceae bacterium]|nr:hypothetical protein [Verrucomicrobiaceae bacterium]